MVVSEFVLRDPNFETRIKDSFSRQGLMRHINATIEELVPGKCVVTAPFQEYVSQQHGFFHGGVIGTLADVAGAYAAFTLIETEQSMLTVEFKINFLSPAEGSMLRAVGEVLRAGRTLTVSQVSIWALDGASKSQCATALVTVMTLVGRGDR
jgi:uncharacterized protein (TIGR00369 family)